MEKLTANARPGLSLDQLCAGLHEPVLQSQQIFRQVLRALSEPGTRQTLAPQAAPRGVDSAAYQVCLALLDSDTPLWVADSLASTSLTSSLRFHCGCPIVAEPGEAAFAIATPQALAGLDRFCQGSHDYPDRSTTLILQVDSLHTSGPWQLSGPGIDGRRAVGIDGLESHWLNWLEENHAGFPLGIDLLLTAGNSLMGLPRTTRMEVASCM